MENFYGPELARIHSEGFTQRLVAAYPWLLTQIRTTASAPGLWDVGCGDGSWLAHARDAGVRCSGTDRSSAFVTLCRQKGLSVACDEARTAEIPANTSAVTALGEVLCYEPAAFDVFVERLSTTLPPGSGLWFDLIGTQVTPSRGRFSQNDWHIESVVEISGDTLRRQITIETARGYQREIHHQKLFNADDVIQKLQDLGFTAHLLNAYGDVPLLPGRFAIEARRPG